MSATCLGYKELFNAAAHLKAIGPREKRYECGVVQG
jgi:hypothetical protein